MLKTTMTTTLGTHSPTAGAQETEALVEVRDIHMSYRDGQETRSVLKDVSLAVHAGELCMLTGESGSGKSTLLAIMAGLTEATSGEVLVASENLSAMSEAERSALRLSQMGIIFQQPNLLSALNAREQLLMMDHLRGLRGKALKARAAHADELLAKVGLAGLGDRRMGELSGGQRQRVGIARALMNDPVLLLADEPTSALDRALSDEVMELLARLTREINCASVVITHDQNQVGVADRVLSLVDGEIFPGSSY
ncbi:putative ABC transport system ATP-binding protein [Corynebacterium spheniscorum]|uniref:Putative ABC transport system ATP-binding protein n=2 Tax=Corynebacterium spheniscorum TaxID=185761 RepID=A0A1I2ULG2_9CORY|nr:ABC transporter ATP-binding protein [Corynebacterium spheniscorum]SFG77965.1 putative ABC transport system ATP-binding protein [Corynebacterium spheniscorum]